MYIVLLYALLEWTLRVVDDSFKHCRELRTMVNTTHDPGIRGVYVSRVLEEDARVWGTVGLDGATTVEDACTVPSLMSWLRILCTLGTIIVSVPLCIKRARHRETSCAESSLPTSPKDWGPPPIFPPKHSHTEVPTESASPSHTPTPPASPLATPGSPSTPHLLYSP